MSTEYPSPPPDVPLGSPTPPAPRRLPLLLAGLAGIVIGGGAVGAVWGLSGGQEAASSPKSASSTETLAAETEPSTFTLTGTFELTEGAVGDGLGGCEGSGGYDDITEGAAVTVYDAAGTVVATGQLGDSTLSSGTCTFEVAVEDVPRGEDFYKVEISHRGTVQLSGDEAEAGQFGASLG
ncbi:hypothetical protein OG920_18775 [Streptomyces europaeiscabiei]|uniref:hypothetical protein n=1 Tax=Streptomyces europaeiscabiei TaxID=146819 RepID=UPI0029A3DA92|nr:hypothetical protein [Streptomyces europaeiscabiei]MDX3615347.1 hypothetical protein [Streptomyces europaeiscabiei]MDX3634539.1 hypothetical protein [Streptomyces europaeiscabiei]MDX3654941.1 hypothetical protein [Streptomyces europaeiscabiei]